MSGIHEHTSPGNPEGVTSSNTYRRPILYEGEEERLARALANEAWYEQGGDDRAGWREWAAAIIERLSAGSAEPDEPSGREGR